MTDTEIREAIKAYIADEILVGESLPVGDHDELLIDGIIDSLGVTRVIGFIGREFGVPIPREEATIENFRTVTILAEYVKRKLDA